MRLGGPRRRTTLLNSGEGAHSLASKNLAMESSLQEGGTVIVQALLAAADTARVENAAPTQDLWTWSEAMASPEKSLLMEAAQKEYDSLIS